MYNMASNNKFVVKLNYGAVVFLPTGITMAERKTAIKNFNNAVVLSQQPLVNEAMFEVCIEGVNDQSFESLEIGATTMPPDTYHDMELKNRDADDITVYSSASCNDAKSYTQSFDLRKLKVGDCVGIMRKRTGSLQFFVNGKGYGEEVFNVPENIYALINYQNKESTREMMIIAAANDGSQGLHHDMSKEEANSLSNDDKDICANEENLPEPIQSRTPLCNDDVDICTNQEHLTEHIQSRITEIQNLAEDVSRLFDDVETASNLAPLIVHSSYPLPVSECVSSSVHPSETLQHCSNQTTATCLIESSNNTLTNAIDQIDMDCPLRFHPRCGLFVIVINEGKTALRPNAYSEFNNAVTLTNRPLKDGELFEVKLDRIIEKWAGSIEIGLTCHQPHSIELPTTITNILSKTIVFAGNSIVRNGVTIRDDYPFSTDNLKANDKVSATRKSNGDVHFYVNDQDMGVADRNFDALPFGIVDVYGRAARISIVSMSHAEALCTSHLLNADRILTNALETIRNIEQTLLTPKEKRVLRFNSKHHGKNIQVSTDGKRAFRVNPTQQFNHAVLFSNRPLLHGDAFVVEIENVITSWVGSLEMGVTTLDPAAFELPATMTDLERDTWILSGSNVIHSRAFLDSNYLIDLDKIKIGMKLGIAWKKNGDLHFSVDGVDKGVAATSVPKGAYGFFDLYGKCTQVRICESEPPQDIPCVQSLFHSSTASLHHKSSSSVLAVRECLEESNHVVYTEHLRHNECMKVTINETEKSYMKTLSLGLSTSKSLIRKNMTRWTWCGDVIKRNDDIIYYPLATSLLHLQVGNTVSLQRRNDCTLHCYINCHHMGVVAYGVPKEVYPFVMMEGCIKSVKIEVEKDRTETCACVENKSAHAHIETSDVQFDSCFCGENIDIHSHGLKVKRIKSYKHGLVLMKPHLATGKTIQIKCTCTTATFDGSLRIGLLSKLPQHFKSISTIYNLSCDVVMDGNQIFYHSKVRQSVTTFNLATFKLDSVLSIHMDINNDIYLQINDESAPFLWYSCRPMSQYYVIFDVYGSCGEIVIL